MRQIVHIHYGWALFSIAAMATIMAWFFMPGQAVARANNSQLISLCADAARYQERRNRIPAHLLQAIAAVESGRWDKASRANIAWPWTVTAKGKGRFFPNKNAAIRAVGALQREGVTNIDVGCMQINLAYHPDAFETLDEAFEPAKNVAYAATFLIDLRETKRSWTHAVRFYHSSDKKRQRYYGRKVNMAQRAIRARERRARTATAPSQVGKITTSVSIAGSSWPPRGYRAQRRMEISARVHAFNGRRR